MPLLEAPMTYVRQLEGAIRYRLLRPIAEGGMGSVYEAEQIGAEGFRKRVAIKLIKEAYSALPEFRQNFVGEARLVCDLIHANIVQTYHLGEIRGHYFMVMEFVQGINLEEFILQHRGLQKPVPLELACFIVSRICRGLNYAHRKQDGQGRPLGIVHRDVNPRNIMLSSDGDVKLTDFGIAKALNLMYNQEGEVIAGKDEYLSPEQARREVTDARADLFSCGVILLELVCGRNLFEARSGAQTRDNIQDMPLPPLKRYRKDISKDLQQLIQRALERDREKRFQTAQEMLDALEMHLYRDGYGPTHEKLAHYLEALYAQGKAYLDDLDRVPSQFGLRVSPDA